MFELAVPSVVSVVGPKKAIVRWEGGPVLTVCTDACLCMRRTDVRIKPWSLRWSIPPFPKLPAGQFVTLVEC